MNLPSFSWSTAIVVIVGIAAVWAAVYFKFDPSQIGATATAFIMLAGALEKLWPGSGKGGGATGAAAIAFLFFSTTLTACAAFQKVEPFLPTPAQLACVEVEADNGTPALMIIAKCELANDALAFIENFLLGHKQAKAIRAAQKADGGLK